MIYFYTLHLVEKYKDIKNKNKYNYKKINHTTKILRCLNHLNKTDPD